MAVLKCRCRHMSLLTLTDKLFPTARLARLSQTLNLCSNNNNSKEQIPSLIAKPLKFLSKPAKYDEDQFTSNYLLSVLHALPNLTHSYARSDTQVTIWSRCSYEEQRCISVFTRARVSTCPRTVLLCVSDTQNVRQQTGRQKCWAERQQAS